MPPAPEASGPEAKLQIILATLDEAKGEQIVSIPLHGKTSIADYMVIVTGRSNRHVSAMAEQVQQALKRSGNTHLRVEGMAQGDWVLIDQGDIIVHLFRAEVRSFYNLEKMWSDDRPKERPAA